MSEPEGRIRGLGRRLLGEYLRGPEHPFKQRLVTHLRRITGFAPVRTRVRGGGLMELDDRDLVQRTILHAGAYEPEVWEALATFARPGDVLWDVGAHVGGVSVRALRDGRIREVRAFEPDPRLAAALERNLALNGDRWHMHRIALARSSEPRALRAAPEANRGLGSLAPPGGLSEGERVACRSIDELVFGDGLPAPTLMKVDAEGAEPEILEGAGRLLRERPPRALVLEDAWTRATDRLEASVADLLRGLGYTVWHLHRPAGVVEPRENFLAVYTER